MTTNQKYSIIKVSRGMKVPAALGGIIFMEWRPVKDFEGLYEVSSCGKVRNRKGLIMKTRFTPYERIILTKEGRTFTKYVHRLVAEAFIDNPNNYCVVCHKIALSQGGTNSVENLYWGTVEQNIRDMVRDGHNRQRTIETQGIPVKQIDKITGEVIAEYETMAEASRQTGICASNIRRTVIGSTKTAGGYKWEKK